MRFGALVNSWRLANRYGVRELAKIIGLSPATLSRFERGEKIDADTFLKILTWATKP